MKRSPGAGTASASDGRFGRQTRKDLSMTFNPVVWHPVAIVLSALNLVGAGVAAGMAEPWHAAAHAVVALGFGAWARRLRASPDGGGRQERLEELEAEVSNLGRELGEAQERLDFTERLLAQEAEARRVRPER